MNHNCCKPERYCGSAVSFFHFFYNFAKISKGNIFLLPSEFFSSLRMKKLKKMKEQMLFRFLEKVTDNREEKEEGEGFWKLAKNCLLLRNGD